MNQDERLISLTERLYVGFVKYVNFFEEEIIRLESELEKNGNGTKEAYKDMKIQYSDKMNNNINSVDKPISDNVDKYECLTKESSNNYSEEKINYDEMKKESQFTCNDILTYNESNKSQISDSKFKGSCESLEKLKLENDLELQKENHKIYNIYADRILFLYYQLKEGQQQQTSTILPVKSNDMENQIVYNSKETLSDLYHEETLNNVNKKELADNTKLYKKSRG
uniref:Uncharacterized protein n=1 Tax=Parastrongyloides trichosuri TaxID=131310 RepID=A0A0N5A468_PARTI